MRENSSVEGSNPEQGEIPADHPIWDVWDGIRGFYPGTTVNWDNEPPVAWISELRDLTPDQLAHGMNNLCNHVDEKGRASFPPNAGEFKNLCLNNFDWKHSRQSRPASEVLSAPLIDRGEGRYLESPETAQARELGTPATNPDYFKDLMESMK